MLTCFLHTAGPQTRVTLFRDHVVVADKQWPSERRESEMLQPTVDALLKEVGHSAQEVEQLVACVGPGGFTSTRVGVSAANAWAFAAGIPLAGVSLFELYPQDMVILVAANPEEAWVQMPGEKPTWMRIDALVFDEPFSFSGILDESWTTALEGFGGTWEDLPESLPDISQLRFSREPLQPWYYKDPNITWSDKIRL